MATKSKPGGVATCEAPGCGKRFRRASTGRPPRFCEKHRRPRGVDRHPKETRARDHAKRRMKKAAARGAAVALDEAAVMRLAAGLSMMPGDVRRAARLVGIELPEAELLALESRARTDYPEVIAGDPAGAARIVTGGLVLASAAMIQGHGQIAPRDLPHVTRAMAQTRDMLIGGEKRLDYQQIVLEVVGSDGKPLALAPAGPPPTVH